MTQRIANGALKGERPSSTARKNRATVAAEIQSWLAFSPFSVLSHLIWCAQILPFLFLSSVFSN